MSSSGPPANSSSNPKRGGGRGGGGGRGRGRGGGRRSGRGRSNRRTGDRNNNPNPNNNNNNNNAGATNSNVPTANGESQLPTSMPGMRDEEVLIAFMPYLKGDNQEAMTIHERYQSNNDQQTFLRAARDFLARENRSNGNMLPPIKNSVPPPATQQQQQHPNHLPPQQGGAFFLQNHQPMTPPRPEPQFQTSSNIPANPFNNNAPMGIAPSRTTHSDNSRPFDGMDALERDMMGLIADDDPVVEMPGLSHGRPSPAIGGSTIGSSPAAGSIGSSMFDRIHTAPTPPSHLFFAPERQQQEHSQPSHLGQFNQLPPQRQPITPPRQAVSNHLGHGNAPSSSPFSSLFPTTTNNSNFNSHNNVNVNHSGGSSLIQNQMQRSYSPQPPPNTSSWANNGALPPGLLAAPAAPAPIVKASEPLKSSPSPVATPKAARPDPPASETPATTVSVLSETPKAVPPRKEYQPKRLWTRIDEQPGKILANNVPAAVGTVVDLHPREELKAKWMLPLSYLRQHAASKDNHVRSIRDLLDNLAVGLFRRGCTENGAQASIVSKEILSPAGESRSDYPFQVTNDAVVGTVPFFSPRTPGHVVFRLYWQNEPLYTLATGPTLNVRVTERDFESSIRFILSNFKAKKVNPTSLSSLNSLSLVLEQFQLPPAAQQQQRMAQQLEGAGRGVWGCICEARKVLDTCASEYHKTTAKLQKLEDVVEELKVKVEEEEKDSASKATASKSSSDEGADSEDEPSELVLSFREKQKTLMSGRASCERKWRDSQLAFASILRAVVTNPSMSVILRRELISKLRLEYELWCPLSEEFAVPGDSEANNKMWYEPLNDLPHTITADHFRLCTEARSKLQQRSLGFDPNASELESILYPKQGRNPQMNPAAVGVFNQLSTAMGQLYQENYATADLILRQREMIRMKTEAFVSRCDCFPPGTKVAIFGSSANGFGSPKSDLDMCLQIPSGHVITDEEDPTGMLKMAKLATLLEENGMKEVDTTRLTARIPVIKFNCPKPLDDGSEGEEALMECDLSMHNPLAVLNTSLLRTYAEINPVPRVLAGVIKRWAKARDINNPARHTLSSYGYILMLLHFLTSHQRSGNGLVSSSSSSSKNEKASNGQGLPLLPNLQWMDGAWPEMPVGTPYKEHADIPKKRIQHPIEERAAVNSYFYHPNSAMLQNLQRLFPGQDLSLGILLASFFRYYAYEFDYKRYVVSLHSTLAHGLVEREVKAELDGWRNYSAALTIEDPFETFYDVAHVLRGGYYHRIRREFAVAYSKIADVASGKTSSTWNNKPVDLTKMAGMDLIDWICEPVATDRDDASTQR